MTKVNLTVTGLLYAKINFAEGMRQHFLGVFFKETKKCKTNIFMRARLETLSKLLYKNFKPQGFKIFHRAIDFSQVMTQAL